MKQENQAPKRYRPSLFASLRASFLTGLVVVAPIGLTIWLMWSFVGWVDNLVLQFVPEEFQPRNLIGVDLRGIGAVIFLVFTIFVGWLAKGMIGRSLIHMGERMVDRMPVVRSIYNGIKQIAETVFAQSETSFDTACLVEYPRKGLWAIAFISTSAKGEIRERVPAGEEIESVFLPTTPNPTSGFLLFVPRADLIILDMSVEDAAKLVISAGLVYPESGGENQLDLPLPLKGEQEPGTGGAHTGA